MRVVYFIFIYENRRVKPVEIILIGGREKRTMKGLNLRFIISTYVNITMYTPVQQLYANK
jgi:hypothetical protein